MISVIVLNWNGKAYLKECLDSLRNQTFKNFEVILVDNGSTDGSIEYIKNNFPEVRILALEKNVGFSKGNNEGIKISQGEYVVLLNNDTRADRFWLEELYKAISKNPRIGFCASKIIFYSDQEKIDAAGDGYSLCGAPFKRGNFEHRDKYTKEEEVFGACAAAAIYRKSMLNDIGLLDEDFFMGFEDSDLSFRAQLRGYKCLYVPKAIVFHRGSATIGKLSNLQVYYGQRNVEYVYIKNMPTALIFRYFFFHLIYNLGAFLFFLLKGRGLVFLKAKLSVLMNLRELLKKREIIQRNRKVDNAYLRKIMGKKCFTVRIRGKF
jgi:hypothetical protein